MPKQDFLRFAMMHPFRLLALVISGILITACGVTSQASPTAEFQPTAGPSTIVTEAAMEIPVLEMDSSLTLPPSTEKPQVIQGELALFYLKEIYKDNITGWWLGTVGYHAEYKFVDVSGAEVRVKTTNVKFDSVGNVVTIFDDAGKPLYTRQVNQDGVGVWLGVTEDDPATHFTRELNLDGRHVNWNADSQNWELSLPITNEQLQLLGPQYSIEDGNLVYNGSNGKFTVIALGDGRDLKIKTEEGGDMTFAPENLVLNPVMALDYDGSPINIVMTMKADGWGTENQFMYTPTWGEGEKWTIRPDVTSGIGAISLDQIPETDWNNIFTKRDFYAELLALHPNPENVRDSKLQIARLPLPMANVWGLTNNFNDEAVQDPEIPLTYENDNIQLVSVDRFVDPNGARKIKIGLQYPAGDRFVILHSIVGEAFMGENFKIVAEIIANPSKREGQPILSARPGEDCTADGGLGFVTDQTDVCALYQEGSFPQWPRLNSKMPRDLLVQMKKYDDLDLDVSTAPRFDVGPEMTPMLAQAQEGLFPTYLFVKRAPQYYGYVQTD